MFVVTRPEPASSPDSDLAGALHEVSNALTVVLGWLGDAREKLPEGALRDSLDVAYKHAHRGHAVARRAIRGDKNADAVVRSCESIVADAAHAAMREAAARGVRIERDQCEDDATVDSADSVLQILVNLLLNAIAFSPPGGVIRITPGVTRDNLLFCVSDEGPGIPEMQRPSLFVRGNSLRPGGAGIGLSHSYALAQKHGGELRLVPSESGAAFELEWPVSDSPSRTSQRVPAAVLNGMRVLVLEDDAAVLAMVQMGLAARGVEVLPAAALSDVEHLASRGTSYDAAFVDLSPIQADPHAAFAQLRATDPGLPIILISGSAIAPRSDLPLSEWVHKPFEVSELCEALARVARPAG
jgi:CheY-like chemotaxis protein